MLYSLSITLLTISAAHSGTQTCHISDKDAKRIIAAAHQNLGKKPNPLKKIHTEGTLPGHGIHDQSVIAEADFPRVYTFALAYQLTHDPVYLNKAIEYLEAWAALYKPSFNPIDETNFGPFIQAYALLKDDMPSADRSRIQPLIQQFAEGYIQSGANIMDRDHANWQSHRIKIATLAAAALGDRNQLNETEKLFKTQISYNIRSDGSVEDFYKRDALHYVTYDLQPLVEASIAAHRSGRDWFHYRSQKGGSLTNALNWLVPYAEGTKQHIEFLHSTVPFDKARRQAGVEAEQIAPWQPQNSAQLFWLASQLDKRYRSLASFLQPNPPISVLNCEAEAKK
ncbi:alginate lyase family protein [Brucella pseudintermedia]|uniref:alginate lyase family protein n=1 Tax=Brucella pseudintermedia TaxID=370111 RepID=UPI000EFB0EB4|nr:alginate lyase family protein [Brucella pseudintermedia]KAB2681666.1 alginate lyase family protein [Brucella pseudintermedia]